jgi:hypothetical protein
MLIVSAACSASFTIVLVYWYTLVQRLVPSSLLGRVSSLDWLVSTAGVPLSFALVGPIAAAIGARQTLILAGVAGAIVILAFLILIPGTRGPERDGSLVAPVTIRPAQ